MKFAALVVSFISVLAVMSAKYIFNNPAPDNSVLGVSHSLACPCECPMVLEDCHMSCGMEWKDMIGQRLMSGGSRDDIEGYFFKRFGKEAMLTPLQRISGKWYQITRGGYPISDIMLFSAILLVWSGVLYFIINGVLDYLEKRTRT